MSNPSDMNATAHDAPEETTERECKRARLTSDTEEEKKTSAESLELALAAASRTSGVEIKLGMRLEVRWGVVDEIDEDQEPDEADESDDYDEKKVGDKTFDPEERTVCFCAKHMLIDLEAAKSGEGGGDSGFMQWRLEGSKEDLPELLAVGSTIKARYQGGETYFAGVIAALNADGTYNIMYADGDEEDNVDRHLIETVDEPVYAEGEGEDEPVAESIDGFFEIFTAILTDSPVFTRLDADKQLVAAEKIAAMKGPFREELEELLNVRGSGATVTGDDIKTIIPRVMERINNQAEASSFAPGSKMESSY